MTSVALGNFDGVHSGHRAVLQNAARFEQSVCLLFRTHPARVLGAPAFAAILSREANEAKILECGIGRCAYLDFEEIKDFSPEQFFEKILIGTLGADVICCGYNYSFGKDRRGNVALLRELCARHGKQLLVSEPVNYAGAPVSSSRIRACLQRGEVEQANAMLGYNFFYEGEVVSGKRLGRELGFPTLNQYLSKHLVQPRAGVYAASVRIGANTYRGLTNIGDNPTIGSDNFRSETYVFDFDKEVYGQTARIELLHFIRPEQTFESIGALRAQVLQDIERAKENV
ncbi:MAG: bifunctional riboflavin kinase/FAD synthetase [Ruminococcaceae bacterium]|nr:bifunctional riboflavin kinase/FAD synthetase [Oscillospiraceae bacterium]